MVFLVFNTGYHKLPRNKGNSGAIHIEKGEPLPTWEIEVNLGSLDAPDQFVPTRGYRARPAVAGVIRCITCDLPKGEASMESNKKDQPSAIKLARQVPVIVNLAFDQTEGKLNNAPSESTFGGRQYAPS
jgi:hypothetical protein